MTDQRIVINRDGQVFYSPNEPPATMRGYVDKYRPVSSRLPWRGVKIGGHAKYGFRTRKEASEWVVKP